ncbi:MULTISPECIES: metal ABC transporter ATP-binding protein [unclassified Virgibacillus]|uniref:metal ABC transporter ATP-binding protein n=1 Tax=unclassified Virgibacillus TaxID=2620237 RepID=UPI0024DE29FC|nr:metal ABC transporter ATP-binding protein [Virgibacillus sp. LDC-1]
MGAPLITLKDVSFSYDDKEILSKVNFQINKGSFLGLIGPNGGGKTTLTKLILGLIKPDHGEIFLFGMPISNFKDWNRIGFVSQKANSFNKGFPATVFEVVAMGLTAKIGYLKFFKRSHKQQVLHAIEQVGMQDYAYENIGNLSGGQQQRVFIARSLVSEPELLILDEPTVGVDYENVQRFYELLHELNKAHGITLLLVTHDTGTMTEYATDIACLNKTLHFHGNPNEYAALKETDLSRIYGHQVSIVTHDHE